MARTSETGGGIGGWVRNIPEFVNQVRTETAKVAWPTARQTWMITLMVVVLTTVLALFFLAVDNGFNALAQALLKLVG